MYRKIFLFKDAGFLTVMVPEGLTQHLREGKVEDGQISSRTEESRTAKGNAFTPKELPLAAMATLRGSVRAHARLYVTMDRHAASASSWSRCCTIHGGTCREHQPLDSTTGWCSRNA